MCISLKSTNLILLVYWEATVKASAWKQKKNESNKKAARIEQTTWNNQEAEAHDESVGAYLRIN